MRSCEVFGIQELNVIEEKFGKRIDKEIAMGAQKWVDVNRFNAVQDCIDTLKGKGYQIIATTPHNDSCLIHEFDISKKSALFFGTERDGLSQEIIDQAYGYLKIPMVGFTESLNISVSAAIIIQDITNRLRLSDINWQLSEEEILEKDCFGQKIQLKIFNELRKDIMLIQLKNNFTFKYNISNIHRIKFISI